MLTIITGGSGSGKSEMAEAIAMQSGWPRYYIATMQPFGQEAEKRIARHRQMRQEKKFKTIEQPISIGEVKIPTGSSVLVECLSNLCANEVFLPEGAGECAEKSIIEGLCTLYKQSENMVVVTNEIFSDGIAYDECTRSYIALLGRLNQQLFQMADRVVESVYGLPLTIKGGELS